VGYWLQPKTRVVACKPREKRKLSNAHTNAEAGATDAGLGSSADYTLASNQLIRGGYELPVSVTSNVQGGFGVASGAAFRKRLRNQVSSYHTVFQMDCIQS
jgi:hypothetical protein